MNLDFPYINISRVAKTNPSASQQSLAAELERDVCVLALDIGPRGYHAPAAYLLAEQFLTAALTKLGYTVQRHAVECIDSTIAHNLIVEIPGRESPEKIITAGAHYDSVERCPAANDNASGVAGILAMARALRNHQPRSTIRLVLFANEEPPHFNMDLMGSQLYAKACHARGESLRGMFCLETIGCFSDQPKSQQWPLPGLDLMLGNVGDFICFIGPTPCKPFLSRCAAAFEATQAFSLIAAAIPGAVDQVNWSDHRGFNTIGCPAFMITDTAPLRYPHYHAPSDTPDKLNYVAMARIVGGATRMLIDVAETT